MRVFAMAIMVVLCSIWKVGTFFNFDSCLQYACGSVQFTLNSMGTVCWVEASVLLVLGLVNWVVSAVEVILVTGWVVGVFVEAVVTAIVVGSAMQRVVTLVFTCWTTTIG